MGYAVASTLFLLMGGFVAFGVQFTESRIAIHLSWLFLSLCIILFLGLLLDFLMRLIASRLPYATLKLSSWIGELYLIALLPITASMIFFQRLCTPSHKEEELPSSSATLHQRISEVLKEKELEILGAHDKRLLLSMASFRERLVKEVMVTRQQIFALEGTTSVLDAAREILDEGYSRIPIYKESIDNIIGVLRVKDLFAYLSENMEDQDALRKSTIEPLVKSVLFAPEMKKISLQLQDFKKHQVHMAIVVDEYGGTEGLITIEDILEELVGEILDEYDFDEKTLYKEVGANSYIVDARMSLIDMEKYLGISLPKSNDYDSLGGFLFDKAGMIPSKGFTVYQDDISIEVLYASARKVRSVHVKKSVT